MKKDNRQRLFEVMGRLDKTFKPKLNETGEWVNDEDDIAWKEALKSEVQKIESETNGKVKLLDVRGFDKYQGPYAITEINGRRYKIWTSSGFSFDGDNNNLLWIENYPVDNTSSEDMNAGFMGTSNAIVDMLNNETKQNEADGMEFGVDSMPQPMNENKSQKRLFEVMSRLDKTFKPKLNEEFTTSFEYEKELEADDIYTLYQFKYGTAAVDSLPEFPEIIKFTIDAYIREDYGHKPGTESDSESFLYVDEMNLVEGSYIPEYKKYIEEWIKDNAEKLDEEIIAAYSNSFGSDPEPPNYDWDERFR